jgi:hypothetical protein
MANALRLNDRVAWRIVAGVYFIFYGCLLWSSHGLPYAIDNNESFSSLVHARNLHDVSWSITKGLTDEVEAYHPAASPFVHTHQGNVPRLYAYFLYCLGARSIESQIAITTFTVGLLAVWFAYRFIRSIGPPVLAAIVCLVMITDYGLFAQWQVNTYRVWYGFFFFASLLWVAEWNRGCRWHMVLLGILNFAAMFYGEYVFATFVGLTAALFAGLLYRRRLIVFLQLLCIEAAGGLIAAGILLTQLTAYMGWDNVKRDINYTLKARNMAFDSTFAAKASRFYSEHHIVFFNNYFDSAPQRTFSNFISSLFKYHLRFYDAWICLSVAIILTGALMGECRRRSAANSGFGQGWLLFFSNVIGMTLLGAGFCYLISISVLQMQSAILGRSVSLGVNLVTIGCALAVALLFAQFQRSRPPNRYFTWAGILRAVLLPALAIYLIKSKEQLFGALGGIQWSPMFFPKLYYPIGALAFVACVCFATSNAAIGSQAFLGRRVSLRRLFGLSASVFLGYAVVYRIFTGYIFSGYLVRQAPFLVFWTDSLIGSSLFFILEVSVRQCAKGRRLPIIGSSILLLTFAVAWISLQTAYWRIAPPTNYAFLRFLNKAPFLGRTFVVNAYPAPVAVKTRAWAYAESSIFSGQIKLTHDGFSAEHDKAYLWFADANTNPSYLKPDYGLEISQPSSLEEAMGRSIEFEGEKNQSTAFAAVGCVNRSLAPMQAFLQDQLVSGDGRYYTIVKFDWDFPPFLQPIDDSIVRSASQMSIQQKMTVSNLAHLFHRHWRLEIEPLGRTALGKPQSADRLIAAATIDGESIFSADSLKGTKTLTRLVAGKDLNIKLCSGADRGRVRLTINEMSKIFDLRDISPDETSISFSLDEPYGKHTSVPDFPAGMYVKTTLVKGSDHPSAEITYHYAHQERKEEEKTTVRIYHLGHGGEMQLVDSVTYLGSKGIPVNLFEFKEKNPDTVAEFARVSALGDSRTYEQWLLDHLTAHPNELSRKGIAKETLDLKHQRLQTSSRSDSIVSRKVPLLRELAGWSQISVTPGTRSKNGPEYFGLPFDPSDFQASDEPRRAVVIDFLKTESTPLTYGALNIRLRFPSDRLGAAEPIVTTGIREAGDFLYVIYCDRGHIRIGFDHWFNGGPITPPISVDYARDHQLYVSMGSLFPSSDDILFAGISADDVISMKGRIKVTLDGATVINYRTDCYTSTVGQVTIGKNTIKGTTSLPLFSGNVIGYSRSWPESIVPQGHSNVSSEFN